MTFEHRQNGGHPDHVASDHVAYAQRSQASGASTATLPPGDCLMAACRQLAFERQHPHDSSALEATDSEEQVRIVGTNTMGPRPSGRVGAGSSLSSYRR